jgi:SET domain-containing protein
MFVVCLVHPVVVIMAVTRRKKARKARKSTTRTPTRRPRKVPEHPRLGPANEWFELRESPIQGIGAFALKDIPKGTRIIEYVGEKISNAEADRRYDDESMSRHHTFLFILNSKQVIDANYGGNASMYINHSCDPNCETFIPRGHIWIDALKDIKAGEELTYDYMYDMDKSYTDDDLFNLYACRCGAAKCRKTIVYTKRRPKGE